MAAAWPAQCTAHAAFSQSCQALMLATLSSALHPGTDLQGDERERALRAAAVVAGARICKAAAAAAPAEGPTIEPWQLSMFLLQREEQAARQRQGEGQGGAADAAATAGDAPQRHVAKGTVAY